MIFLSVIVTATRGGVQGRGCCLVGKLKVTSQDTLSVRLIMAIRPCKGLQRVGVGWGAGLTLSAWEANFKAFLRRKEGHSYRLVSGL